MSKRVHRDVPSEPQTEPAKGQSPRVPLATLGAVAIVAVFGYITQRQTNELRRVVDFRLDQIDTRLVQLFAKVDAVGTRAAASNRSGPDPNRVYTIKTDGSPSKGPLTAAVTIAEFSDFQ